MQENTSYTCLTTTSYKILLKKITYKSIDRERLDKCSIGNITELFQK